MAQDLRTAPVSPIRHRGQNRLTVAKIRSWDGIDPPELSDGGGLYLQGSAGGQGKHWRLRITLKGKRTMRGLGPWTGSLADARRRAEEIRAAAKEDRDLIAEETAAATPVVDCETFRETFNHYWRHKEPQLKNAKHRQQWLNTMSEYVMPTIGNVPIDDVTPDHIIEILTPIWRKVPETADRVKQRISTVFQAAIFRGVRTKVDPTAGAVKSFLGPAPKAKLKRPALRWQEAPQFVEQLRAGAAHPITRLALEFVILTASRPGEVCGALWSEIDLEEQLWLKPKERMKSGVEHRVPLSTRAMTILREAQRQGGGASVVFPAPRGGIISDSTMSKWMRDGMGLRGEATPHGFRSTFKTWCAENKVCDDLVSEAALAHTDPNAVRAAYHRTDYLDERRGVMERWARYVSGLDWSK